jgi:hypothetical protein
MNGYRSAVNALEIAEVRAGPHPLVHFAYALFTFNPV